MVRAPVPTKEQCVGRAPIRESPVLPGNPALLYPLSRGAQTHRRDNSDEGLDNSGGRIWELLNDACFFQHFSPQHKRDYLAGGRSVRGGIFRDPIPRGTIRRSLGTAVLTASPRFFKCAREDTGNMLKKIGVVIGLRRAWIQVTMHLIILHIIYIYLAS